MLKGAARIWFSRLTPNSISTFKELSAQFTTHFIGGHRYKKSSSCLISIRQRDDETLRSYISRFNKEALSIDEADNKILVVAFTNRLRKGKFLFSLYKNDPKTMSEVLYRTTKYMNAEDARKNPRKGRGRKTHGKTKGTRRQEQETEGMKGALRPSEEGSQASPLLTALIDQFLMQIKDGEALTCPKKLKGDPNR